jgi:hypothetical protein
MRALATVALITACIGTASVQQAAPSTITSSNVSPQVWMGGGSMYVAWLTLSLAENRGAGSYNVVWDTYMGHIRNLQYDVEVVPNPDNTIVLLLSRNGRPCSFFKADFADNTLRITNLDDRIPIGFALSSKEAVESTLTVLRKQAAQHAAFYTSNRYHGAPHIDTPTYNPDLVPSCK